MITQRTLRHVHRVLRWESPPFSLTPFLYDGLAFYGVLVFPPALYMLLHCTPSVGFFVYR